MNSQKLLKLAKDRFADDWCEADEKLFRATGEGQLANYGDGDPAEAENWGEDRILKANRVEWLCTDHEAAKHVTFRGVQIAGARIDEELSMGNAVVEFPLAIVRCSFVRGIVLWRAHTHTLDLDGSCSGSILADGLRVDHELFMRDAFRATGEVRLLGAKIGGDLTCSKGVFSNPDGVALSADALEVGGGVFLDYGFSATGEVRLLGAKITTTLDCSNGLFKNPDGYALNLDGIEVMGSVFLNDKFSATGEVRMLGAKITATLDCMKGSFNNPYGYALNADRIDVKGSVFLNKGFTATGQVRLLNAKVGSNLDCEKGVFSSPDGNALNADGLQVGGDVFLRAGFRAEGRVDFSGATVGGHFQWVGVQEPHQCTLRLASAHIDTLWDEEESWPREHHLDGLVYDRLESHAPTDAKTRIAWLRREVDSDDRFIPQPYVQLAKVLQEMGHEVDARRILIAKQEDPARVKNLPIMRRIWHHVLGLTIAYGYRPWQALVWIALFLAVGIVMFQGGPDVGEFAATKPGEVPAFNAVVYSIDSFVPLIDLQQAKYWFPTAGWPRLYLWLHTGVGWALTTLLVVGLTGLVRK